MAKDQPQAGATPSGESGSAPAPASAPASAPAPVTAPAPADGAPETAAQPGPTAVADARAADGLPSWYPRGGFRGMTEYTPDRVETAADYDVSRWYTSSEGGLSTGEIAPPGLGARIGYAGFWAQLAALALDAIVVGALILVSLVSGLGVILIPLVLLGYFPFFWIRYGASPGMRVCGLLIVRAVDGEPIEFSEGMMRFLVFLLEIVGVLIVIGLAGFIVAAFEKRKRAVHDLMAGTVVVQAQLTEG